MLARGYIPIKSTSSILVPNNTGTAKPMIKSKKIRINPIENVKILFPDSRRLISLSLLKT
jgi:hypothetical protein